MVVALLFVSLAVIFYSNNLLKPNYSPVEIQYITSNDTNFAYISTCANQSRITTVVYKELPPLQDALDAFNWAAVEDAFAEQRRLHPSGNVYLPTDLYEAYLNVLVPYLEQPVCILICHLISSRCIQSKSQRAQFHYLLIARIQSMPVSSQAISDHLL